MKAFYRFDGVAGMRRLITHEVIVKENVVAGEFEAYFTGQSETTVYSHKGADGALGKLFLLHPERLALIVENQIVDEKK